MIYGLPKEVEVNGTEYAIRSDFRAILDIMEILNDTGITDQERASLALGFFYYEPENIPAEDTQEAIERLMWFIRGGEAEPARKTPRLMDWRQDFRLVIAPINKNLGHDIRGDEYCHWWTFLAAYMEIGECLFSNVLRIRQQQAEGKKLDKADREFYTKNRDIIDLKTTYTAEEKELLKLWGGGGDG